MRKRAGTNTLKKRREARSSEALRRTARRAGALTKALLIAAALCGGAFFGARHLWIWLNTSQKFIVRSIEVKGAVRVDQKEIRRLSQIKEGARMLDLKPAVSQKAIMGNCWVRRADVSRRFPSTVIITVKERLPIALVNIGQVYYMDSDGFLMPLITATYSDVPLISGVGAECADSAQKRISPQMLARIQTFFDQANKVNASLVKHVSQIDFSNESTARFKMQDSPTLVEIDDRRGEIQWPRFQELMDALNAAPEGAPQRISLCYGTVGFAQW